MPKTQTNIDNFLITKQLDDKILKEVKEIFYQGFYSHYANTNPHLADHKKYLTTPDIFVKHEDEVLKDKIKIYLGISDVDGLLKVSSDKLLEYAKIINTKSVEDEDFIIRKNEAIINFLKTHSSYFDEFLSPENQEKIAIMFDETNKDRIIGFATFKIFDNSLLDDLGNKKIPNASEKIAYVAQASINPEITNQRCSYKIAYAIADHLEKEGIYEMTFITRVFNQKAFSLVDELDKFSVEKTGESIFTKTKADPSLFGYSNRLYKGFGVVNVIKLKKVLDEYFIARETKSPSASINSGISESSSTTKQR